MKYEIKPIRQRVWKIGNTLVISIPNGVAEMLGILEGDIISYLPLKENNHEIRDESSEINLNKKQIKNNKLYGIGGTSMSSQMKIQFLKRCNKESSVITIKAKNSIYEIGENSRIYLKFSKYLNSSINYWFGIDLKVINKYRLKENKQFFIVFLAGDENFYIFPWEVMEEWLRDVPRASDGNWKMIIRKNDKLRLTNKPLIDISEFKNELKLLKS